MSLAQLPGELLMLIASELPDIDLCSLRQVNKVLYRVGSNRHLWSKRLVQSYPNYRFDEDRSPLDLYQQITAELRLVRNITWPGTKERFFLPITDRTRISYSILLIYPVPPFRLYPNQTIQVDVRMWTVGQDRVEIAIFDRKTWMGLLPFTDKQLTGSDDFIHYVCTCVESRYLLAQLAKLGYRVVHSEYPWKEAIILPSNWPKDYPEHFTN